MLASDLIARTERHLYTGAREERNKLAWNYTAGGTILAFTYELRGIQPGAVLAVDTELFYVWAVDASAKGAEVTGAWGGSAAANHSSGSIVTVNPRFSSFDIFNALNDELADLSSPNHGLYQVKTVDLTWNTAVEGYDLTAVTDLLRVQEVRWRPTDTSLRWPEITDWELARSMPTTDFPSGLALILPTASVDPGVTVRVKYRAPFASLATTADDVTAVSGLHAEALDILPLGAAWRLVLGREIKRNFTEAQPETRHADEVPPGAAGGSATGLARLRDARIAAEAARLVQRWGP